MWEATGDAAPAVKLLDDNYKSESTMMGAGGMHTFTFEVDKAANAGDSFQLLWNNARSWEMPEGGFFTAPTDSVIFTIA